METPNSMVRGCVTKLGLKIEGQLDIFISNRRVRAAKTYVPVELCSEILSRLPVKSLLRFRCVSKSWRSLIDDPQFCDLHFKAFQNNSHENHLLIVETNKKSHQLSILIVCKQTLEKTKLISALAGMDRETPETWYAWSAVDGLLFLRNKCLDVMLWNPSIRRCRRIPGVVADADLGPLFSRPYGVGFDPVSHDYKYVKLFYRHGRPRVGVYSVGTNSWESRQLLPWEEDLCTNCNGYRSRRVNLRGSFYYAKNQELLVSFSFSTMVFTHQSLPLAMSDERIWLLLGLIDGGSTLAAIGQPWRGPGDCIIWALETSSTLMMNSGGVSVRWTKRYTISTQCLTLFPTSGCHVVFHRHDDAIRKQLLVSYNIETQEERIIQRNCSQWIPFVRVYKESLVLLN